MKGEADFNYNQINVIVSGKLDKIFYELLFSELLKSDVHVKNEDGNFRAKQLLKIGESYSNLDVDPKGKDKEVLDECFNYSESDFVIGIIDYDDGINYYLDNPSYKLKKDLPMHIAYTDGADIESMVNYYQPNLLMQALKSRYDMPNEKEIQECIDKTIKNSAKLRMIRLTENGLIKVDDNESKYFLPNNPTFIMEKKDVDHIYKHHIDLSHNQNQRYIDRMMDENGNVEVSKWFDFSLLHKKLKPYKCELNQESEINRNKLYKPFKEYVIDKYQSVENDYFYEWLDDDAKKGCLKNESKKYSYQMRGHDIEPLLRYLLKTEVCISNENIRKLNVDPTHFDKYCIHDSIKPSEYAVLYANIKEFINSDEFKKSQLYKRIMNCINRFKSCTAK